MWQLVSLVTQERDHYYYVGGHRVCQIFSNLTKTGEDNDFDTAMTKLTEYFTPLKNTRYEIYKFRQLKQEDSESVDTFHMRLREASCNCEFTNVDSEIEQQIITDGKFTQIRKSALKNPNYTLKDMLVDGRGKEFSSYQAKDIESKLKEESLDRFIQKPSTEIKRKCFYCGCEFPHKAICPAKGKLGEASGISPNIQMLDTSREEISSDEYLYLLKFSNKQNPIVDITVKSKTIGMTIDTGTSINVIDEETFKRLGNI